MNPQIQIPVASLKPVLQGFSKVIPKRPSLPVLGCVVIESTDSGVRFIGTNLDDYLTTTVQGETSKEFKAVVPIESLSRIVKGCSGDATLTIVQHEGEVRIAHAVGSTTITERIPTMDLKEFPEVPKPLFTSSVPVGPEFKEALLQAFDSCTEDSSRYILQHAYIDVSDKDAHYIVATDGKEMFAANSFRLPLKDSVIVPQRKFLLWNGFLEDGDWNICLAPAKPGESAGWIQIQSEHWTLITKQVEGNYPNWRTPIPVGDERTTIKFSEVACSFIKLAAPKLPGHGESLRPVALHVTEQGHTFIHAGKGDDAVSLPINGVTAEGKPIKVCINRDYLLKALKLGLTELQVFNPNTPVIFKQGGKRLIVAPLRDDTIPTPGSAIEPSFQTTTATTPVQIESKTPTARETINPEPQAQHQPEEMKTINRVEEPNSQTEPVAQSAFVQVKDQLESLKERLRGVVSDLNDTIKLLGTAQKEKKATEREIESIRETLRGLQQVRI